MCKHPRVLKKQLLLPGVGYCYGNCLWTRTTDFDIYPSLQRDETHFHRNGHVTKQNIRFRTSAQPREQCASTPECQQQQKKKKKTGEEKKSSFCQWWDTAVEIASGRGQLILIFPSVTRHISIRPGVR